MSSPVVVLLSPPFGDHCHCCLVFTVCIQSLSNVLQWRPLERNLPPGTRCSLSTSNSERDIIGERIWPLLSLLRLQNPLVLYACFISFSLRKLSLTTWAGLFGVAFLEQQICLSDPRLTLPVQFSITPNGKSRSIISEPQRVSFIGHRGDLGICHLQKLPWETVTHPGLESIALTEYIYRCFSRTIKTSSPRTINSTKLLYLIFNFDQ